MNIQDNANINSSLNTYIKTNITMNNPNANINIKFPQLSIIIFILNTNTIANTHLHILIFIKTHITILKYGCILMQQGTNISKKSYTHILVYQYTTY